MQRGIDWADLRILLAVGRLGSLAAAASALGVHRSTVMRGVERLEASLGLVLFDRSTRGLALTAAGERLMPHAESIEEETASMLRAVDVDHGRRSANLRVAATLNLAYGLLPRLIARFSAAYPGITVDVTGTADGVSSIHPDQFDIALRTLEADVRKHERMVGRRVGKLPLAVYGARAYFADRKVPRRKQDVGGHRLLLGNGPLANIAAMRWMSAAAENAELVYRASSMLLLLAGVRDGLGICCLPRYLCEGERELIRAFNVPEEHCADLWILRHAHHRDNARMRAFTDFMAAEFRKVL
jgi:DNA-binding transcriptional LysR family regulator